MQVLIAQLIMVIMAFYYYFTKTSFGLNPGKTIHPLFKKYVNLSFNFILRTASLECCIFSCQFLCHRLWKRLYRRAKYFDEYLVILFIFY